MIILEYEQVDPWQVWRLNLLCLDYDLTPEKAAEIRRLDKRPFPFFALYAVEDGVVAGQVGVFRLPVVTTDGPDAVGGAWAVATHPAYTRRGIASSLMNEAHQRMKEAGLSFSTLNTSRRLGAYALYRKLGYEEVFVSKILFARRDELDLHTSLVAGPINASDYYLFDAIFNQASRTRFGFACRQSGFMEVILAHGDVSADNLWLLYKGDQPAGYAFARQATDLLKIDNLLLLDGMDPVEAVAALLDVFDCSDVWLWVEQLDLSRRLQEAGLPAVFPGWGTFMVKALSDDANVDDARKRMQTDTDRFLISMFDVT